MNMYNLKKSVFKGESKSQGILDRERKYYFDSKILSPSSLWHTFGVYLIIIRQARLL